VQLAIQGLPRWQGDANCSLNLGFHPLLCRFHPFAIYRDFSDLNPVWFFYEEGRKSIQGL